MEKTLAKNLTFDCFEIDAARRLLLKNGEAVALNQKTFDLLLVLATHRGEILSKNELLETVWEGSFVEENNLTVHISALRKIFGEKKGENRFIATVPGKGYKFVGELNEQPNEIIIENHSFSRIVVDEEIELPPEKEIIKQLPPKRSNRFAAFALIGLLIVAGIGVWFFVNRSVANAAPIESIAVMPFVYEGSNSDNEYLSDGMTESLINNLSQLPKLTVKARNSVFQYKGKQFDANKIAGELSVQAILLGRITERGDSFILSLELVDAKTNNHLWGEQYTRKTADLATLQTEIAHDVSAKLRQKLNGGGEALQKGQTANSEAYQLYLKGRYLWNKRNQADHEKAITLFEQAIRLDPNFALAYVGLGDVYTVDSFHLPDEKEKGVKGRAAALKALEIAPDLAEADVVLAKIEWDAFNWLEAEKHFKRALELNPNYASAHQWHAEFLMRLGKKEESLAEINRALELDPLSLIINSDAIYLYALARQYDRALAHADKTLELDANWAQAYTNRALVYEYQRNFAAVLDDGEKYFEFSGKSETEKKSRLQDLKEIREALAKDGARGYWQKGFAVENRRPPGKADFYYMAITQVNLGNKEAAFDCLEKAIDGNNLNIDLMKVELAFESLHSEPRFHALLRRINLEP